MLDHDSTQEPQTTVGHSDEIELISFTCLV